MIETHLEYEGHVVGDEFTFEESNTGIMRRARFTRYRISTGIDADWIDCVEVDSKGGKKTGATRSIHPHMIRKWWRKKKVQPTPKQKRKLRKKASS